MVYKKFIKKNGKIYGPYTYHSRRENGKVVSEYHGKSSSLGISNSKVTHFDSVFALVVGIFAAFLLMSGLSFGLTGNVVLDAQTIYNEGENLAGVMSLSLKEGELIPASTEIVIENNENVFNYSLEDLVSEEPVEGVYYIEGKEFSGSGLGYGLKGNKGTEEIEFVLVVTSEGEEVEEDSENVSEKPEDVPEVIPEENEVGVMPDGENSEDETSEETEENSDEVSGDEVITGEVTENSGDEILNENEDSVNSGDENSEEVDSDESSPVSEAVDSEVSVSESENSDEEVEAPSDSDNSDAGVSEESASSDGITGGAIAGGIFGRISNFFLTFAKGFGITGQATLELNEEVSGKATVGEPFIYGLSEGQKVELKSGSVINSDGESLDDDAVDIQIVEGVVKVTPKDSISEEGYGEEYLGSSEKVIEINISELNILPEEGDLKISLIYSGEEILSVNSLVSIGVNQATNVSGNLTFEKAEVGDLTISLSDEDLEKLMQKFGENFTVEVTKAEVINGRLLVRLELEEYWTENSYEYKGDIENNSIDESLEIQISNDRVRWLSDIVKNIDGGEEGKAIDGLLGKVNVSGIEKTEQVKPKSNVSVSDNNSEEIIENNETKVIEGDKNETVESEEVINNETIDNTNQTTNVSN